MGQNFGNLHRCRQDIRVSTSALPSTGGTSTVSCLSPTNLFIVLFSEIEGDLRVVVRGISMLSFPTVRLVRSLSLCLHASLPSPTRLPGTYVERLCSERSRGPSAGLSIASSSPGFPLQILQLHVSKATFATRAFRQHVFQPLAVLSNRAIPHASSPIACDRFQTTCIVASRHVRLTCALTVPRTACSSRRSARIVVRGRGEKRAFRGRTLSTCS